MLIETLQDRTDCNHLGDDPDHRTARESQQQPDQHRYAEPQHEQRAEYPAQHAELSRREAHHTGGREHRVVGDPDHRVDRADGKAGGKDGSQHESVSSLRVLQVAACLHRPGAVLRVATLWRAPPAAAEHAFRRNAYL